MLLTNMINKKDCKPIQNKWVIKKSFDVNKKDNKTLRQKHDLIFN